MMAHLNGLGLGRVASLAILAATVVGCAGSLPSTTGGSGLGSPSTPARAQDTDDHFRLVFELPKTTWRTTEEVTGAATLTLVTPTSMTVWGSGAGILGFDFAEVGGDKNVGWIRTADCAPHQFEASTPLVSPIRKTASYSESAPATDFYRVFGTDPLIHLPAGDWRISAVTDFTEDGCGGTLHELQAALVIHVVA